MSYVEARKVLTQKYHINLGKPTVLYIRSDASRRGLMQDAAINCYTQRSPSDQLTD